MQSHAPPRFEAPSPPVLSTLVKPKVDAMWKQRNAALEAAAAAAASGTALAPASAAPGRPDGCVEAAPSRSPQQDRLAERAGDEEQQQEGSLPATEVVGPASQEAPSQSPTVDAAEAGAELIGAAEDACEQREVSSRAAASAPAGQQLAAAGAAPLLLTGAPATRHAIEQRDPPAVGYAAGSTWRGSVRLEDGEAVPEVGTWWGPDGAAGGCALLPPGFDLQLTDGDECGDTELVAAVEAWSGLGAPCCLLRSVCDEADNVDAAATHEVMVESLEVRHLPGVARGAPACLPACRNCLSACLIHLRVEPGAVLGYQG